MVFAFRVSRSALVFGGNAGSRRPLSAARPTPAANFQRRIRFARDAYEQYREPCSGQVRSA